MATMSLLGSSAYRPQTEAFGHEPYPTLPEKVAALVDDEPRAYRRQ
jgi:hypothetical protein